MLIAGDCKCVMLSPSRAHFSPHAKSVCHTFFLVLVNALERCVSRLQESGHITMKLRCRVFKLLVAAGPNFKRTLELTFKQHIVMIFIVEYKFQKTILLNSMHYFIPLFIKYVHS